MALTSEKIGSDKYQKIIQAAIKVFAEKGFYNAKVSDVAKQAQVADGTIYLYFKNKDDLLISIFEESMDTFIAAVVDSTQALTDPVERLKTFIYLHLEEVRRHPDTAQVLQIELRQSSRFIQEYAGDKFRQYLELISEILEAGQQQGCFRKDLNPVILRRAIFGAIDEMALEWVLMKKKKYHAREVAEQISKMMLEGLNS